MDKSSQFTQMTIAQQPLNAGPAPSEQSLRALDGVNFFVGGALAGFGPFVTVFLGEQDWRQADIGFVLTVGGVAGLLAQYPSGELLDAARSKRLTGTLEARRVRLGCAEIRKAGLTDLG